MPRARQRLNADAAQRLVHLQNSRNELRVRGRQRQEFLLISQRKVASRHWVNIDNSLTSWTAQCLLLITGLAVCAFCAAVGFGGVHDFDAVQRPANMNHPPAVSMSVSLHEYMTATNDGETWWRCKCCGKDDSLARSTMLPTHTPDYIRRVLSIPASWLQSLSFVDICMDVSRRYNAFACGTVSRKSVIDAPLLTMSTVPAGNLDTIVNSVLELLAFNVENNPLFQAFKCMYEIPTSSLSFPIVTSDALARYMAQVQRRSPLFTSSSGLVYPSSRLSLLSDLEAYEKLPASSQFKVGNLHAREHNAILPFVIGSDSLPTLYNERGVTMEAAVFPYIFPHGQRFWKNQIPLGSYLKWRMSSMFSLFTMCAVYPLLMYQLRQLDIMCSSTRMVQLEAEIYKFKQRNPEATEEQIYQHVCKYTLPDTMPGSPSWHRKHLQDLIHTVAEKGMPSLFLTLTADEISDTRWSEIAALEQLLSNIDHRLTYDNCPVECAALFHQRLWSFLEQYIILPRHNGHRGYGLLGRVTNYLVRYEVQGRGSLHAHIILWIHPDDLQEVSKDIIAYISGNWNSHTSTWAPHPTDKNRKLLDLVLKKQMHTCNQSGCCAHGSCQYGFPYSPSVSQNPVYNQKTKRYDYCRLSNADRNVVPYHAAILLLWGPHMNLQVITNEAWSFYVLKYALKTERNG